MRYFCAFLLTMSLVVDEGMLFGQDFPRKSSEDTATDTHIRQAPETPPETPDGPDESEILDLDIDQLGNVNVAPPAFDLEVTSVTKSASTVGKSPAAIYVITPEMIRRSSATSIPGLLRMVPGLQVARIDANKWAVSSRGFNGRFANKLLVMIDGRSVYTPVFSGVYWDIQDTVLQDIERIEVIRGPGATLWGANAVNGVINIITKKAKDTQGAMITSGGGSEDRAINSVRYGGSNGSNLHYRVYGKHSERDSGYTSSGAHDDWRQKRVGFRADWNPDRNDNDLVTFQGDYYEGQAGTSEGFPVLSPPGNSSGYNNDHVAGGNLLTRWTHRFDEESSFDLQFYYDRADRTDYFIDQTIDVLDLDLSHHFRLSDRQRLTWGMRYRHVSDVLRAFDPFVLQFTPEKRTTNMFSAFLQDEITLIEDTLKLTLGSKFEHNDFTGFEIQPGARLLWTLDERKVAWASVSRAVRTPSRSDDDMQLVFTNINPAPATYLGNRGNRGVDSEDLLAIELGYRAQPTDRFSWDAALFYNEYSDLRANTPGTMTFPPPAFILYQESTNEMDGETYGFEVSGSYNISPFWRMQGSYSFLQMQLHSGPNTRAGSDSDIEGGSPHNQAYVQSSWDIRHDMEFDVIGRYVDNLPAIDVSNYVSLDLRLGWRPNENWEFAIYGRNLLEEHRLEYVGTDTLETEVDRGVFAQAVWRR